MKLYDLNIKITKFIINYLKGPKVNAVHVYNGIYTNKTQNNLKFKKKSLNLQFN